MRELNTFERKQLLINMLVEVDRFCRKNGICYFLTGGTLLGAIRHQGFIPWDDDIDIAMFRPDYDKFSLIFNNKYEGSLKWIDLNNTEDYYLPTGKIIDTRTLLIENVGYAVPIGVFIDVFPIDNIGEDKELAKIKITIKKLIERFMLLKYAKVSRPRSIIKNFIILLCKLCPFNGRMIAKKRDEMNKKIIFEKSSKYVANLYGAWGIKEITLRSNFETSLKVEFEGHLFNIPSGFDNYLRDLYGDYMTLPPPDKRVSHHDNVAYWKDDRNLL